MNNSLLVDTSLESYFVIKPELGDRQLQVYEALTKLTSDNNRMISEFLCLPINSVTPRILELHDKKLVIVDKQDLDSITGRSTIFWKVTNNKFRGFS